MRGCVGADRFHFRVLLSICPFVRVASLFQISLRDLCRRLVARSAQSTNFMYFESGYDESSNRGAP